MKVVLAAAMWQNPHVLILDEPTNYLDREGLGALILAIKDYKGGGAHHLPQQGATMVMEVMEVFPAFRNYYTNVYYIYNMINSIMILGRILVVSNIGRWCDICCKPYV